MKGCCLVLYRITHSGLTFNIHSEIQGCLCQFCSYFTAVNTTPSSWSLDSGKEAKNMSECGRLITPPVPPRPTQAGTSDLCKRLSIQVYSNSFQTNFMLCGFIGFCLEDLIELKLTMRHLSPMTKCNASQ